MWNPQRGSYSFFGLDHYATCWLGDARGEDAHNAVDDARKSVLLLKAYMDKMHDPTAIAAIGHRVLSTPAAPSFSKLNPTFEGVCQGNKNTCRCGAPIFF